MQRCGSRVAYLCLCKTKQIKIMRPSDYEKYQVEYTDNSLSQKLVRVAKKAGVKLIYCVLLAREVVKSPDVPAAQKALIIGALGYFICPLDAIPDVIPVAGFTDDLAAIIFAIRTVYVHITPEMKTRSMEQLHKWFGDFDERVLNGLF